MSITGKNIIGNTLSAIGTQTFKGINPSNSAALEGVFYEATKQEVDKAVQLAEAAFQEYRTVSGAERADFLETIAEEILALGDELLNRCHEETGLPLGRLTGERGRTVGQLRLFASLIREGSWVDARIDNAIPDRQPAPKADIRMMQRPIGPVGVFGASNFPLAFSVAGGDTASALAAGCPVVVKGHPAHPGATELVASAIQKAVIKSKMPNGTFSMVQGKSIDVGIALVNHPAIKAIGFTGSYNGGKAIFDAANKRPEPIPVYAEMGSTNPLFILPEALAQNGATIAQGLKNSVTLGVGQFCTNPGITITVGGKKSNEFSATLKGEFANSDSGTMLTIPMQQSYAQKVAHLETQKEVVLLAKGKDNPASKSAGKAHLLTTSGSDFLNNKDLEEEVFGPSTILVTSESEAEMMSIAKRLGGHLTASVFGTENDLKKFAGLLAILEQKVGRLIINAYPTGVEVCHSMVHGGPFPATTDSRMTSVGTGAITRFTRPVCFQGFPDFLLPDELKEGNPLGIRRLVDGVYLELS